jgi:hypothetical protein
VTEAPWPRSLAAPPRVPLLHTVEAAPSEFGQAVALLTACGVDDVLQLPVGVIDRLLLQAHRLVIGRDLEAVFSCRACGTLNALPLGPGDVPDHEPRSSWCGPGAGLREPIGADLLGLPDDPDQAAIELSRRCWIGPAGGDRDAEALDRAEQSLCGPVHISCVECRAPVDGYLDVQQLVTAAVAAVAADVDVEIHLIAARYGWDLATIEALPERRRVRLASLAGGALT